MIRSRRSVPGRVVTASRTSRATRSSSTNVSASGAADGREQAAVERHHPQRAGRAAAVGEPRDRLQRLPEPGRGRLAFGHRPERFDRVAVPVDRVPLRDQAARLGEQQKQDPIDDRERVGRARRRARRAGGVIPRANPLTSRVSASSTPDCSDRPTAVRCCSVSLTSVSSVAERIRRSCRTGAGGRAGSDRLPRSDRDRSRWRAARRRATRP